MLVLTATMLKNKSIILKLKNCTLVPDLPSCCCLYKHVCFTFQSTLVSKTSSTTTKSSSRSQLPAKFNYMKKRANLCAFYFTTSSQKVIPTPLSMLGFFQRLRYVLVATTDKDGSSL